MKTKSSRNNETAGLRRVVRTSLLLSGAFALLGQHAVAQQSGALDSPIPPQLAITKPAVPAESAVQTPKTQVFTTDPALRAATQTAVASGTGSTTRGARATETTLAGTSALQAVAEDTDIPWTLGPDTRPWPLTYLEVRPLNALVLSLPDEREARTMLAGSVSDAAENARFTASRYITDNIGVALQTRGKQLEALNLWLEGLQRLKQALPTDPWAAYQFSREAHTKIASFKAQVLNQSTPGIEQMVADITHAVAKITPVMHVMGNYQQQMQWYGVLVQLKEGMGLYQTRVQEADRKIMDAIEAFERDNPRVARPPGKAPAQLGERGVVMTPQLPSETRTAAPVHREQAQPPAARDTPSGASGGTVLLGVGALMVGFFVMLRKRVASKKSAGSVKSD